FFQAEDGIRDDLVTGVQTCALPISLLDRTMILYGTNLGNANTHVTTNLPTIFAGGGFKHGHHLAFDRDHNYPLPNLFVSMLQRRSEERRVGKECCAECMQGRSQRSE